MSSSNTSSSGIGLGGLLAVLFVALKLCHVIDWSWWWVLSPLWIPPAIFLVIGGIGLCIAGIVMAFIYLAGRK